MRLKKITEVLTEGSYKSYRLLLFITALFILLIAYLVIRFREASTIGNFIEGVSIESFGMLFDILVLGFIFHYFSNKGEEKRRIERYLEEIDDYRGWDDNEAVCRIVGNIKRLILLGQKNLPLSRCCLRGAVLSNFNLHGADLSMANLQRAWLHGTKLQEAWLYNADLQGAILWEANLQGARLVDANFKESYLNNASLQEVKFQGTNLYRAYLSGAKGLTIEMLSKVRTLYLVKGLDPELEKELRTRKPKLFKKPKK